MTDEERELLLTTARILRANLRHGPDESDVFLLEEALEPFAPNKGCINTERAVERPARYVYRPGEVIAFPNDQQENTS